MTWLQWVLDGYTLPFAALLLFFRESFRPIRGKKYIYSGSCSLLCGLGCLRAGLRDLMPLIVSRFIQGVGAALHDACFTGSDQRGFTGTLLQRAGL